MFENRNNLLIIYKKNSVDNIPSNTWKKSHIRKHCPLKWNSTWDLKKWSRKKQIKMRPEITIILLKLIIGVEKYAISIYTYMIGKTGQVARLDHVDLFAPWKFTRSIKRDCQADYIKKSLSILLAAVYSTASARLSIECIINGWWRCRVRPRARILADSASLWLL